MVVMAQQPSTYWGPRPRVMEFCLWPHGQKGMDTKVTWEDSQAAKTLRFFFVQFIRDVRLFIKTRLL